MADQAAPERPADAGVSAVVVQGEPSEVGNDDAVTVSGAPGQTERLASPSVAPSSASRAEIVLATAAPDRRVDSPSVQPVVAPVSAPLPSIAAPAPSSAKNERPSATPVTGAEPSTSNGASEPTNRDSPAPVPEPLSEPEPAEPATSARAAFDASQRRLRELVRANARDAVLQAEVDQFLDYRWLAEQSLGGSARYETACASRCAEFESLLTELIRRNYLRKVRQSERGSVAHTGEEYRKDGTLAKIDTRVDFEDKTGKRHSMDVDYVMHARGSQWKVRDMYTDGVGLAKTYRHDFNSVIAEGGIDRLIQRLERKLGEIDE